jgi:sterol desaturase/sphingolipid hydroxylase (fatty acid hydroxylase superfamily)
MRPFSIYRHLGPIERALFGIGTSEFLQYAIVAGALWLLLYILLRSRLAHRKIIARFPRSRDLLREIGLSISTSLIYGTVGLLTLMAVRNHWTRLYFRPGRHGPAWFWLSIAITILLHDTYFYWTHRLMHNPRLFRWMHRSHHRSTNPTPWTAYAFDPLEAFVQAGIFPLAVILYPIHPYAFSIFMMWQIAFNVYGHCGYELYPRWFMRSWMGKFFNTTTNHTMHHEYVRSNYGLYFNFWDRLMGTNHAGYEARRWISNNATETLMGTVGL